jgi:hypothetical protein
MADLLTYPDYPRRGVIAMLCFDRCWGFKPERPQAHSSGDEGLRIL